MVRDDKLTILCLADRYYSEGRYSTSHPVLEDIFARLMPARGHKVIWLMQAYEPSSIKEKAFTWHGSLVHLLPSRDGSSRVGRLFNFLWRIFCIRRAMDKAIQQHDVNVVQVRNDWAAGLALRSIRKKYGIPCVFQWSFPHYRVHQARIEDGLVRYPVLAKLRTFVERRLYRRVIDSATHVLTVSEWFKDELMGEGVASEKMTPFPLSFDCDILPESPDGDSIRREHQLGSAPVVLYFGDMTRLRKMEFLLNAMQRVVEKKSETRLLMVGAGDTPGDIKYLQEQALQLGIVENVIFTGFVPRERIPAYINASNICVSPIRPIPLFLISSPTKLVESMGMARPIVANDIPEQKKLISLSGGGICVDYDETVFADAIIRLIENPEESCTMGEKGRDFIEKNRSTQALTDLLERIYYDLLAASRKV